MGHPSVQSVSVGAGPGVRGLSGERGTEERRETEVCGTGDITLSGTAAPEMDTVKSDHLTICPYLIFST